MKWTLARKLIAMFVGLIVTLSVSMGGIGVYYINKLDAEAQSLGLQATEVSEAETARFEVESGSKTEDEYILTGKNEYIDEHKKHFDAAKTIFDAMIADKKTDAKVRESAKILLDELAAYTITFDEVVKLYEAGKKDEAAQLALTKGDEELKQMNDQVAVIISETQKIMKQEVEDADKQAANAKLMVYLMIVIGIVLGIFVSYLFARSISRPIIEIAGIAKEIATGNLTVKPPAVTSQDEVGDLVGSLTEMQASLISMIGKITTSSSQVASAADEIAAATDQITKGAHKQASAADETSSSMEQMAANIQSVAKNAEGLASNVDETTSSIQQMGANSQSVVKNAEAMASNVSETSSTIEQMVVTIERTAKNVDEAGKLSEQAKSEAQAGGDAVMKTVEGMKTIGEMMSGISKVIQGLGERSDAIGSIVEVIEEIADQTNLLALNAAIEAARAGDAGRGFAVVADEVRKLAERSVKATKEIGQVIKQVQQETASAVKATENGAKSANEGISLSDKAGNAISKIMESVNATSKIMGEISGVTKEQSTAARNVIKAVEEMNNLTASVAQATKEQSAGVQQIIKSAENMAQMTEQVKNATAEQKTGGENVVKAVENISEIAKTNLSAVEQLSRSAKDLSKQSEGLQGLVQQFKVA